MKYGFRPRAPPSGNPSGENHISWYVPPLVSVLLQTVMLAGLLLTDAQVPVSPESFVTYTHTPSIIYRL